MFNRFWQDIWTLMFVLLIVIGVIAGQGLVIGLGAMGLLVGGVSWLWNRLALEEVQYERVVEQTRIFLGEQTKLTISVVNRKPLPIARLDIEDDFPEEIEFTDSEVAVSSNPNTTILRHRTSLAWYERIRWEYTIRCGTRGFFRIGPARMESGDLFGFFSCQKSERKSDYLLVYPKVVPLPELGMPAVRPLGETRGGITIFQDPSRPSGLREYQVGDPLKIVDWKSTARMQQLQVRTFEPSSSFTVILVVVVETSERSWEGYSPVNLERVITASASVASYAASQQYSIGLFSNGTPILTDRPMKLEPASSPEQLTVILEALATVRPLPIGPMAPQLAQNLRQFPIGSTLVVIAGLLSEDLVATIADLKRQGYQVVVVFVGDGEPPEMPPGVVFHDLRIFFENMETAGEFGPR